MPSLKPTAQLGQALHGLLKASITGTVVSHSSYDCAGREIAALKISLSVPGQFVSRKPPLLCEGQGPVIWPPLPCNLGRSGVTLRGEARDI